ncbi:hypothetical protein ES319_A12G090300v1 [Gossypium barbadense]|uniref:TSL-kinase interacting protein 1 n=1 Tax=Gossypium barbadense TaxID=3634 RepID=A0A5J5T8L7_GOSBA|nr:hypothetical protein ES319_A12G090300v1 [Gossypium barbadense]
MENFYHMGTNRKRRIKALEPHSEINVHEGCKGVDRSRKTRVEQQLQGATGKTEKDEHSLPSGSEERLHPSTKIKLQLFPIDESTRLGLEKDGFHPYLELTLSARKKISSVLKHLGSKWGSSSIAVGEPMLFPYVAECLTGYRWTRNDICISASDVYAAIGSPAVFRLRYGWMSDSNLETKTLGQPSVSAPFKASSKLEDVQKSCHTYMQNAYVNGEKAEVTGEGSGKPIITSAETNVAVSEKASNGGVGSMENEVTMDGSIEQSLAMWADSLTNISIGGLLSEASLQGRSLRPPLQDSHSSILDADDTCHAFPFQKFSSLGKSPIATGGSAYFHAGNQDTSSKSFKNPNLTEANIRSQGQACQQSDTDLILFSRVYNDESSLGFSGIKWTESLGPFDLGLSSSRKVINGDNTSINGIVR